MTNGQKLFWGALYLAIVLTFVVQALRAVNLVVIVNPVDSPASRRLGGFTSTRAEWIRPRVGSASVTSPAGRGAGRALGALTSSSRARSSAYAGATMASVVEHASCAAAANRSTSFGNGVYLVSFDNTAGGETPVSSAEQFSINPPEEWAARSVHNVIRDGRERGSRERL